MVKLCLKCGIQGHTNKSCKNEVTSYGVIAFKYGDPFFEKGRMYPFHQVQCLNHYTPPLPNNIQSNSDEILFLLVERKDTIGFLNLIQGNYPDLDIHKNKKLIKYVSELTCEEREKITQFSFDELWNIAGSERRDYIKAKEKWNKLNLIDILSLSACLYQEADYIMPKGRLKYGETVEECAIREFCEETGYIKSDIELTTIPYYEERFIGTDGKKYKNVFFVAKVKKHSLVTTRLGEDINQMKEVRNIGWFNMDDCKTIMRSYHIEKIKILEHVS